MKRLLPVLILAAGFTAASWADSDSEMPVGIDDSGQLEISVEADVDSGASSYADRQELGQRIRATVLSAVAEAVEDNPKISDEDKEAIAEALEEAEEELGDLSELGDLQIDIGGDMGVGEGVIAIVAIVMIFGMPIMVVVAVLYAGHRKRRVASELASKFLDSGQPVPPEVWQGLAGDTTPRSNLHKGMMMLGIGAGVFLAFWFMGADDAAFLALIPLFIGIAQLLIWKLEKGKAGSGE